ncbi:MAG: YhfC family glutamic-type intramembrane protease [Eubacteriales bacterium]
MVPSQTLTFLYLSGFITVLLPIIAAIIIWREGQTKWWVFPAGMVGFIIMQMVLRRLMLNSFSTQSWYLDLTMHTIPYYLFNAFSAGLFETVGRLGVFLLLIRMRRNYADGLLAGLGHGAIESILLAGSSVFTFIAYALMINAGTFEANLGPQITTVADREAVDAVYNVLTTGPSVDFLASAFERVMAIILHISLSILVLEGIERKQIWPYALVALGYHMLIDFTVPLFFLKHESIWISELLLFIFIIPPAIYILKAKKRFVDIAAGQPKEQPAA